MQKTASVLSTMLLLTGCHVGGAVAGIDLPATQEPAAGKPPVTTKVAFEQELLAAARQFRKWTRVSDHANVAPARCSSPPPPGVHRSASGDTDTHGKKLYFLFAKDAPTYLALTTFESLEPAERDALVQKLVGQVVVKQSWKAVEVSVASVPLVERKQYRDRVPAEDHVIVGDKAYRTGMPSDLFVMLKLDAKTPGTDQGWVYGTVDFTGNTVTSSGCVASCMECHKDAPYDRLFGLSEPKLKGDARGEAKVEPKAK